MRKVDEKAYNAFTNKCSYSCDNTKVVIQNGESYMYLFGNLIAKTEDGNTFINHCGYIKNTTKSRLNAFPVHIRKSKDRFIVNEKFIWKKGWLNINNLD